MCLNFTRPSDRVGGQSLSRSPDTFPGSRVMTHDMLGDGWSCVVTCGFPGSRALGVKLVFYYLTVAWILGGLVGICSWFYWSARWCGLRP